MKTIDVKVMFERLAGFECKLTAYIYKLQGEESAPIDFYAAAEALEVEKNDVRRAIRRLVEAGIIIAEGKDFKINDEIFKK